jgi:hypothetical protein
MAMFRHGIFQPGSSRNLCATFMIIDPGEKVPHPPAGWREL